MAVTSTIENPALARDVDVRDLGQDHPRILLAAQDSPDRPGNIGRRQRGGCDLIKQRLETMMVLFVDEDHLGVGSCQRPRGFEPAEAAADDDHARAAPAEDEAGPSVRALGRIGVDRIWIRRLHSISAFVLARVDQVRSRSARIAGHARIPLARLPPCVQIRSRNANS